MFSEALKRVLGTRLTSRYLFQDRDMAKKIDTSKLPELILEANNDMLLRPVDFRVYAYLCCVSAQEERTYVEVDTDKLAQTLGYNKRTVAKAYQNLETNEYIEAHHKRGETAKFSVIGFTGLLKEESKARRNQLEDFLSF